MASRPLRSRLVIGIAAAVIVVGLAIFGTLVLSTTGEVVDTANTFMKALTEGRSGEAWKLCSEEMRQVVKDEAVLGRMAVRGGAHMEGWSFGRKRVVEHYATLPLKLRWSDGASTKGSLHLGRINNTWQITGLETE